MSATVTLPIAVWVLSTAALILWIAFRPRERTPWQILAMIAVFAAEPFSATVMNAEARAFPLKYDHFLQSIDQALGITAFAVARLLPPWSTSGLYVIYESLTFAMIAWYGLHLKSKTGTPRQLIYAYLYAYCVGPFLYLIVPACGPRHAYPGLFPAGQPHLDLMLVRLNYWPNAIPSLHLATALLLLLFAGRTVAMRIAAWLYLAATLLGTLAFEHYVIDLVVAIPFACFAAAAAQRQFQPALAHLSLVLVWLFAIRWDTPLLMAHPDYLRAAALLTIAMGVQYGARFGIKLSPAPSLAGPQPV